MVTAAATYLRALQENLDRIHDIIRSRLRKSKENKIINDRKERAIHT